MVPYFLQHMTSLVYESCERQTLQGKMLIKTVILFYSKNWQMQANKSIRDMAG